MFVQRNSVDGLAYLGPKQELPVKHPRKTTTQYLHKQSNITLTNFVKGPYFFPSSADSVTKFLSKPQQQQTSQLTSLSTYPGAAFLALSTARKGPSQDWNPGLQCPALWPLHYSSHQLLCCPLNTKTLSTTQQASKMRIYHLTSDRVSLPLHQCHQSLCPLFPLLVWHLLPWSDLQKGHALASCYLSIITVVLFLLCLTVSSECLSSFVLLKFWVETTIFLQYFSHP